MMFGRKKDEEEYEYIRDVCDSEEYGKETERKPDDPEKVMEMFRPYLENGERVLYLICARNGDSDTPFDRPKAQKFSKFMDKFHILFFFVFTMCLALVMNAVIPDKFLIFPAVLGVLLMLVTITTVIVILVWTLCNIDCGNYAITDRRVMTLAFKHMNQLRYDYVTAVKCHLKKDNKGTVSIKEKKKGSTVVFLLDDIDDPRKVEGIICDAVRKYQADMHRFQ